MTVHQSLAEWSGWGWPLLANHLWQATLLSIGAFAAAALLKNASGRARYAIWLIASAKFVLPSALIVSIASRLGLNFPYLLSSTTETSDGLSVIFQLTAPIVQSDQSIGAGQVAARGHNELFCVLTFVWFTGFILMAEIWRRRRRRLRGAMRGTPLAEAVRESRALTRVRSWLGIRREVALLVLPGAIEPGVWGVWKPIVVLPESMAAELSEPELEAVIMHEMIHVARWDNLTANLHRILCCVLWFHPAVWILDWLLLAEREQACDEEVIRLGGASEVYASSLIKVLRFCLGWGVAGASNATGSNLGRRVERIMSGNVQVKFSLLQRVAVASIAALVITLSLATGLLSRDGVVAQSSKPVERGVPGGVPGGVSGYVVVREHDKLIERLEQAPLTDVDFKNSTKAPLIITDAKAKVVLGAPDEPGDAYAVLPVITLANNTDRRIRGFTLGFRNGLERRAYFERFSSVIEPRGVYTSGNQKRFILLTGGTDGWTVRIEGVAFEDGEAWGIVPPPPPPPPPPQDINLLEQAPESALRFTNPEGTPVSISAASFKAVKIDSASRESVPPGTPSGYWIRVTFQVVNNTDRRIVSLAFQYSTPESSRIEYVPFGGLDPRASRKFDVPQREGEFTVVYGNAGRMDVKVVGVGFEDGEKWGKLPGPPGPPAPPVMLPASPGLIRKSGGVMMISAVHRVDAEYPPLARAARITGSVMVEVTVDEGGAVTSARAISGHPLLKDAAVTAARQWQFSPTILSGVAVPVVGTITFNFEP